MERGKRILAVCHCILNSNAKVFPLADVPGVKTDAISAYVESGCGLLQLPCSELSYLGVNRWGMTREQYDHPNYRAHCREVLKYPMIQLRAFARAGYELVGVMGVDGSPSCGVNRTCEGFEGGELDSRERIVRQMKALRFVPGPGVFMEELIGELNRFGLQPDLFAVEEKQIAFDQGETT